MIVDHRLFQCTYSHHPTTSVFFPSPRLTTHLFFFLHLFSWHILFYVTALIAFFCILFCIHVYHLSVFVFYSLPTFSYLFFFHLFSPDVSLFSSFHFLIFFFYNFLILVLFVALFPVTPTPCQFQAFYFLVSTFCYCTPFCRNFYRLMPPLSLFLGWPSCPLSLFHTSLCPFHFLIIVFPFFVFVCSMSPFYRFCFWSFPSLTITMALEFS